MIFIPRIHKKSIHSFIPTPHQTAKVDNSEINLPIITPKCFSVKVLSKYTFLNWKIKNCVPAFFPRQGEALLFRLHQPKISVCDSLLGQEVRRHFFVVEWEFFSLEIIRIFTFILLNITSIKFYELGVSMYSDIFCFILRYTGLSKQRNGFTFITYWTLYDAKRSVFAS